MTDHVLVTGPTGALETIVDSCAASRGVAIVCQPHPLHGGTMRNKVVHTLARSFNRLGARAVRFNFRGVGASAGAFADGEGELDDARAIIAWCRARWPGGPLFLAGFSFGAMIAYRAAQGVDGLVMVAPPVTRYVLDGTPGACPWLVLQGDRDQVVSADAVRRWCRQKDPEPTLVMIEGATHFFHGKLGDVAAAVENHFRGLLPQPVFAEEADDAQATH